MPTCKMVMKRSCELRYEYDMNSSIEIPAGITIGWNVKETSGTILLSLELYLIGSGNNIVS